eukprot:2468283-Pyramimonas_sp.AAC.1
MPAANPVLGPALVQPVSHRIGVRALAGRSSARAVNKALHFTSWILFSKSFPLTRVPPQSPPSRRTIGRATLP